MEKGRGRGGKTIFGSSLFLQKSFIKNIKFQLASSMQVLEERQLKLGLVKKVCPKFPILKNW
jgi:hypothetical protein